MNKKVFSIIGLLSIMAVMPACEKKIENYNIENQIKLKNVEVTNEYENATTMNNEYVADPAKRVTIKLNVTFPETENDVYVIGDFNNWGLDNTLNDSTYKVSNGVVSISNVEENTTYSYMFVQKIAGASYTYNFSSEKVDSNNKQIIGYTSEGKLISAYCVSQTNDAFTFTAVNNGVATNAVTAWNEPVYGGDMVDFGASAEPTCGFHLFVTPFDTSKKSYYIELETNLSNPSEVYALGVKLSKYDSVKIYDANTYTLWGEDNIEPYGAYREFVADPDYGMVCWVDEGEYDIYVKLISGNDSIYVQRAGEGGGTGGGALPTTGYGLYVKDEQDKDRYIALSKTDDFEGFQQFFGDNIEFKAGDVIQLYDFGSRVAWIEDTLNPYSVAGAFVVVADGIKCVASGTYDVYLKIKYQMDEVYIGPAN